MFNLSHAIELGHYTKRIGSVPTEKGDKATVTIQRMIELLQIEHECMLRGSHDDCDRNCADCELVQDDYDLHEMYTDVIALLKDQEPVKPKYENFFGNRIARCGKCNGYIVRYKYCPGCGREVKWDG